MIKIDDIMKNETYEKFVDKFKPKKTTDDCYTPDIVYKAISDWVSNEYDLNACDFVRPFYPGGDFEHFDYENKIVVDNPPFSILAKIVDFYLANNVKFLLFAPALTLFNCGGTRNVTLMPINVNITYENGANVCTSFITNLENPDIQIYGSKTLYDAVKNANDINVKSMTKQLPKYQYPNNVVTASRINQISKYIDVKIPRSQLHFVRTLDGQKKYKKGIYGGGFLCSDKIEQEIKAEEIKAEEIKAEKSMFYWQLSDREKEIIKKLDESKEESR